MKCDSKTIEQLAKIIYDTQFVDSWDDLNDGGIERGMWLKVAKNVVNALPKPTLAECLSKEERERILDALEEAILDNSYADDCRVLTKLIKKFEENGRQK